MRKRLFDLGLAVPLLLLAAPLIAGLALLVRNETPGPAFFKQRRLGRWRRPFSICKLRTMNRESGDGTLVTSEGDARITRIGSWLRRTKLDELPQLWNIVRGEMSFVGPRAEVDRFVAFYEPEWERIFSVRPGVTSRTTLAFIEEGAELAGSADVEARYRDDLLPKKMSLALEELSRHSFREDVSIMRETIRVLIAINLRRSVPKERHDAA